MGVSVPKFNPARLTSKDSLNGPWLKTSDARTALHLAADRDDGEAIVDALLAAGADPAVTDEAGHAPLWYADKGERQAIVDRLRTS